VTYAGGGGGGAYTVPGGSGGSGGGGNGGTPASINGAPGLANLGSGGGGAYSSPGAGGSGGNGGKGVVIIRYSNALGQRASGGSVTTSPGYFIHTFTGDGTFTTNNDFGTSFSIN
jgi:hypothetical protein